MDPHRVGQACILSVFLLGTSAFLIWRFVGCPGHTVRALSAICAVALLIAAWAVVYSVHRPALPDVVLDARGHLIGYTSYNTDVVGTLAEPKICPHMPHLGHGAREVGRLDVVYDRARNDWVGTVGRTGSVRVYRGPGRDGMFVVSASGCQYWLDPATV